VAAREDGMPAPAGKTQWSLGGAGESGKALLARTSIRESEKYPKSQPASEKHCEGEVRQGRETLAPALHVRYDRR
jgi:hypothetical protein